MRRLFIPKARVLSSEEIEKLAEKERSFAQESQDEGVWLEVPDQNEAYLIEEGRIKLPVFCEDPKHEHSLWLDIFCPGDACKDDNPIKAT